MAAGANLTAVAAAGPSDVFAVDSAGTLRRYTGQKWVTLATAAGPLTDVSARRTAAGDLDVWAVGDNGVVLHFHE
jgi:hypothetical protein